MTENILDVGVLIAIHPLPSGLELLQYAAISLPVLVGHLLMANDQ